nr:hypothetical protein [Tanacetum cinerariifolium]GEZ30820.1 hypothetical protein [Tanacetum cinerariifolium]
MLDQNFDRFQKLVSQLELLGEKLSQEDVNRKLLRSLSPEWNTHAVMWKNKVDLDTMSMDDLYKNIKGVQSSKKSRQKHKESIRRIVPVEITNSTALVSCDGLAGYDWSDQAKEGPNFTLMAFTSLISDSKPLEYSIVEQLAEENLHIRFSENTPNVVGSGPDWLFDIDALTRIINFEPIVVDQKKEDNVNSTNNVNTVSSTVNAAGTNKDNELPFDPNITALEDVSIFNFLNDDKDDGIVADMNNMDTTIQVRPIQTRRIHKDHPLDQVIGDFHSTTQTRNKSKNLEEHGFVNDDVQLCALINGKKVVVTDDVVRQDLRLDDADGVECLPNEKIFAELTRMNEEEEEEDKIPNAPSPPALQDPTPSPHATPLASQLHEQPTATSESSMTLFNTLMETCATLSQKVDELEKDKNTQA